MKLGVLLFVLASHSGLREPLEPACPTRRHMWSEDIGRQMWSEDIGRQMWSEDIGRQMWSEDIGRQMWSEDVGRSIDPELQRSRSHTPAARVVDTKSDANLSSPST